MKRYVGGECNIFDLDQVFHDLMPERITVVKRRRSREQDDVNFSSRDNSAKDHLPSLNFHDEDER